MRESSSPAFTAAALALLFVDLAVEALTPLSLRLRTFGVEEGVADLPRLKAAAAMDPASLLGTGGRLSTTFSS